MGGCSLYPCGGFRRSTMHHPKSGRSTRSTGAGRWSSGTPTSVPSTTNCALPTIWVHATRISKILGHWDSALHGAIRRDDRLPLIPSRETCRIIGETTDRAPTSWGSPCGPATTFSGPIPHVATPATVTDLAEEPDGAADDRTKEMCTRPPPHAQREPAGIAPSTHFCVGPTCESLENWNNTDELIRRCSRRCMRNNVS